MKRRNTVSVRLTEEELEIINKKVSDTTLSRESYIRQVVLGNEIKPTPPIEYNELKRELSAIGNNLNQIARVANRTGSINEEMYWQNVDNLNAIYARMLDEFE